MSVYFYRGHAERHGSTESAGSFCGVVVATDALAGYESAMREQIKSIRLITDSCAANFSVIFDKFEKVE